MLKSVHYHGDYDAFVQNQTHPDGVDVALMPGAPVNVSEIRLHARTNEGLSLLTTVFAFTKGQRFTHQGYDNPKHWVLKTFLNAGYLKGRFVTTQVGIVEYNRSAELRID